jgi:hypothetical protein
MPETIGPERTLSERMTDGQLAAVSEGFCTCGARLLPPIDIGSGWLRYECPQSGRYYLLPPMTGQTYDPGAVTNLPVVVGDDGRATQSESDLGGSDA